jgi:hypothetical protein
MNTNIKVTQTINVKIKDVDYTLTTFEATGLYNALGTALNLHKPLNNPNQPWQPMPYMPYKFPNDIWYGIPPVSSTGTPPINFCQDNVTTSYTSDNWNNAVNTSDNFDKKV